MGNHYENGIGRSRRDSRCCQNEYYDCNDCGWETAASDCGECAGATAARYDDCRKNQCECKVCTAAASNGSAVRLGNHGDCIDGEMHVYFEPCDGLREVNLSSECHNEDSLGRALDVTMKLCNVCPGRRCAVGVHLTEMDEGGNEYARGFRAITVPAHNGSQNRDLVLPALRFILPEDVSLANGANRRHFVVRTTNHYMEEPAGCCWKHKG